MVGAPEVPSTDTTPTSDGGPSSERKERRPPAVSSAEAAADADSAAAAANTTAAAADADAAAAPASARAASPPRVPKSMVDAGTDMTPQRLRSQPADIPRGLPPLERQPSTWSRGHVVHVVEGADGEPLQIRP